MFLHAFYYGLKQLFRDKTLVWWTLLFPVLLSTLFYAAFSGLSEDESLKAIPVAVVQEDNNFAFDTVIRMLSEPGENQFLEVIYADQEEALSLLEAKEVVGVLQGSSPVTLLVSAEMSGVEMEKSILSAFVEQYNAIYDGIVEIAMTRPEKMAQVVKELMAEKSYMTQTTYSDGTMDESVSYFFNLIAMVCLYSAMGGMLVAVRNQANLSALGARRCMSPTHKLVSLSGEQLATWLFNYVMVLISICYQNFILKVSFGSELGYVLLAAAVGCMTGVSLGFLVGSIGRMSESTKLGILMVVIMFNCFLSGLMVQNMRIYVGKVCPWYNKINPAALIADSFYALTVYASHDRFFMNLATLLAMSVVFCLAGYVLVRREKYANL